MVNIRCVINGKDISDKVKENLVSLTIVDNDGVQADTLNMTLSNYIKRPEGEDTIKLWIDENYYGVFIVNETETNDINLLTVSATSVNFHEKLKEKKNRSYEDTTLKNIIEKIAKEHGLKSAIEFVDIRYDVFVQERESDLHFLKRIADKYDAIFAIKNNTLIFKKRDAISKVFTVDINDCKPWSIRHIARKKYKSCKASWRSTSENKTKHAIEGSGDPVLNINGDFFSSDDAKLAAKGALAKSKRQTKEGHLSKKGEYLSAGSKIKIIGSKQDDGVYTIKTVTTTIDKSSGFRIEVSFEN